MSNPPGPIFLGCNINEKYILHAFVAIVTKITSNSCDVDIAVDMSRSHELPNNQCVCFVSMFALGFIFRFIFK